MEMERYNKKFKEDMEYNLQKDIQEFITMYINDPEFIARNLYTILNNGILSTRMHSQQLKTIRKTIAKYLADRWM